MPFQISTLLIILLFGGNALAQNQSKPLDFNKDVRPILSENCFHCHGPDEQTRKAKLRLDTKEFFTTKAKSGKAIILPANPSESELFNRLVSHEPSEIMPPPKAGKVLSKTQIDVIRHWILNGAKWSEHWAFIPPNRPKPPVSKTTNWSRTPVDQFVLTQLEKQNRSPAPEASKEILIRRVSLDLTGLPPTPAEIRAFLDDNSPDAYEKVVDRLFKSEHYGERMAMQWLDYARFADSNGFQTDSSRSMWPWRNWVISAFNQNMPFDQFTLEQLAGDMLPNPTQSQIVATGFNRNHRLNGEGGLIAEEWRTETVIDRVETTGLTWLGLTLGCARCHDHKYDPITQRDFYQLFAFFNNIQESGTLSAKQGEGNSDPVLTIADADQKQKQELLAKEIKSLENQLLEADKDIAGKMSKWEEKLKKEINNNPATWISLAPNSATSNKGTKLSRQPDGSYLASGSNPSFDTYEIEAPLNGESFSGLLLECLTDPSQPGNGAGRYSNGNFVLSAVEAEIQIPGQKPKKIQFSKAVADYSQNGWNINNVLGADRSKGWAVDGPTKKENRKAMFLLESKIEIPKDSKIHVRLIHASLSQHNIGKFRLSFSTMAPDLVALEGSSLPGPIKEALATEAGKRTKLQNDGLMSYFKTSPDYPARKLDDQIAKIKKDISELEKKGPTVMVMKEGPARDSFILIRGQYDQKGEKVTAGFPKVFSGNSGNFEKNRLGLAKWIINPSNPLTARVWVNRTWEKFFGTGLVKSTDNLGSQSDFPNHQELLDWLATEFMRIGWDMKALQKTIVMSSTYRQSSKITPDNLVSDPENKWFARGPRFRLQGEIIRDQALAVSGLLTSRIGGPSSRPYMPDGVWDETSRYGDLRNYKHDKGDNLYRRSMYTIWKRTAAPPSMLIFDAPNREICSIIRSRTNTPLQALALLNEVTYVEAAKKLGERMLAEGGTSDYERIQYGLLLARGRKGTEQEAQLLLEGLKKDSRRFDLDPDSAKQILSVGEYRPNITQYDPKLLAAYMVTANILLNLDEVVTRE